MSITLGTLIILFFLIPGLVFRKAFFVLPFDKRYNEGNNISEIGIIIIVSLVIHYLGLQILSIIIPKCYTEFEHLFCFSRQMILANGDGAINGLEFDQIDFKTIVIFQFFLWFCAALFGIMFNSVIRYFKWDRKYRTLRFGNSWYYYFSGEALEFPHIGGDAKEIDYIFVDVLVRAEGREILYIGILSEYDLSVNGGLKSIALRGAKRRFMESDLNLEERTLLNDEQVLNRYYTIPSNLFVIPYNENVININFRYFADDDDDEAGSDNSNRLEIVLRYLSLAIIIISIILLAILISSLFRRSRKDESEKDQESQETEP